MKSKNVYKTVFSLKAYFLVKRYRYRTQVKIQYSENKTFLRNSYFPLERKILSYFGVRSTAVFEVL